MNTSLFRLPFNVPAGWQAIHLANLRSRARKQFERTISTFDFETFYNNQVNVVVCDTALDVDGAEVANHFSVWIVFDPEIVTQEDKELIDQLYDTLISWREDILRDDPDNPIADLPVPVKQYCPDMGPFWAYYDAMKNVFSHEK